MSHSLCYSYRHSPVFDHVTKYPHLSTLRSQSHIAPSKPPLVCDWTITGMLSFPQMGTSTFLVLQHALTLFSLRLWLHQEVFRWSQWHWAKQLALSRQNGFRSSVRIVPLICLQQPSEERASDDSCSPFYQEPQIIGIKWKSTNLAIFSPHIFRMHKSER